MNSPTRIIAGVEIGTACIKVLIADVGPDHLRPLALGTCTALGVLKGSILDKEAVADCFHAALAAAERKASAAIEGVYLALSGAHLDGFAHEESIDVSTNDGTVTRADIDKVNRLARAKELPAEHAVVHFQCQQYHLDGRSIASPDALHGRKLTARYWIAHADRHCIADGIDLLRRFDLQVDEPILSSLASGAIVTSAEERRQGVLVLDIGGGTTDYVLYRDGRAYWTGVLTFGGDQITNDIHLRLRVTVEQAEQLKRRLGRCVAPPDGVTEPAWVDGDLKLADHPIPVQLVERIVTERLREVFEIVVARLGTAFDPADIGAGVVITGGTAKLPGVAELAKEVFGLSAHLGMPPSALPESLRDPSFSTVLGLFHYRLGEDPSAPDSPAT